MFVARPALHVAVRIVLYLADALFLGFLECLGVGNALTQTARQTPYKVEVALRPLNLVLADGLLHTGNILAETVGGTVPLAGIFVGLLDFIAQFALIGLAVPDGLGIFLCQLQPSVFQCSFIGYGLVAAAHALLCVGYGFFYVGLLPAACLLEHFHDVRTCRVKLSLHFYAAGIHLAALDALQLMKSSLARAELVVHHDVQHIAYALVDVVVAHAVLHRRQQSLHLARSRIADIAAGNQNPRKVGDTFHGSHVKRALEAHSLAQVSKVAADGAHGIVPQRLVVTVIVGQSGCSRRNALLQAHALVFPNVLGFFGVAVQVGTFIGFFALFKQILVPFVGLTDILK